MLPVHRQAQAKEKVKSYDFRSESVRGMHLSYPAPEPVATPRAREGLRAVVPTIFPPGTVNRGESVRLQPCELGSRDLRLPPLQTAPDGLHFPKKRGPKPRLRFKDSGPPASQLSRPGAELQVRHAPLGQGEELRLLRVNHGHKHQPHQPHRHHQHHRHHRHHQHRAPPVSSRDSYRRFYAERSHQAHARDAGGAACRATPFLPQPPGAHPGRPAEPPLLDKPSPGPLDLDLDEVTWRPCLSSVEQVLVTDVTSNLLTVTIKESSTSQGFFKAKR